MGNICSTNKKRDDSDSKHKENPKVKEVKEVKDNKSANPTHFKSLSNSLPRDLYAKLHEFYPPSNWGISEDEECPEDPQIPDGDPILLNEKEIASVKSGRVIFTLIDQIINQAYGPWAGYEVNHNAEDKWVEIKRLTNTIPCLETTKYIIDQSESQDKVEGCLLTYVNDLCEIYHNEVKKINDAEQAKMDAIHNIYTGEVMMISDATAYKGSFERFDGNELNGWLDEKEPYCGQKGTVIEVFPFDKTLTIQFEDEKTFDFPMESVAKQLSRAADKLYPETYNEEFIREFCSELEMPEDSINTLISNIPLKQYPYPKSEQERKEYCQYLESMGVATEIANKFETALARILHMKKQDDEGEIELPDYMKGIFEEE